MTKSVDQEVLAVSQRFANEISALIRRDLAEQVHAITQNGNGSTHSRKAAGGAPRKRNNPTHCVESGCKKPHAGPRYSFHCLAHYKPKKATVKAAAKAPVKKKDAKKS